jgi:hypothetical protein
MNGKHEVALWAGVAAFFGSLLAIGIFDVLNPEQWVQYLGALLVAFITGGSIYAKQRYNDAKEEKETKAVPPPTTYKKPAPKKKN